MCSAEPHRRSNAHTNTVIQRLESTPTRVDTHSDTHPLTKNEMRAIRGPVMESNGDTSRQPTSAPGRSTWQPRHQPLREIIVSCCLMAARHTHAHVQYIHSPPNWLMDWGYNRLLNEELMLNNAEDLQRIATFSCTFSGKIWLQIILLKVNNTDWPVSWI